MARRKAAAKKKAPAKKRAPKKGKYAQLPAGYEAIAGFAQTWDHENEPLLEGKIVGFHEVSVKRGKKTEQVQTVTIERASDGVVLSVWESATLQGLFEQCEENEKIAIAYQGLGKAKPGQNAPKLFAVGYK